MDPGKRVEWINIWPFLDQGGKICQPKNIHPETINEPIFGWAN